MMNGCISHIYYNCWEGAFTLQRQISPRNKPHPGQTNENVFLKKPMPLIPNAILNKSTRCLIMCNIHLRVAIRENPDSHSTIDTTNCLMWTGFHSDEALDIRINGYSSQLCFHITVNDIDCGSVLHTTVPLYYVKLKFIWVMQSCSKAMFLDRYGTLYINAQSCYNTDLISIFHLMQLLPPS